MWAEIPIHHVHRDPVAAPADDAEPKDPEHVGNVSALFAYVLTIRGFRLVRWASGRHAILFPTCRSKHGKLHRTVYVRSRSERREIARRLLDALRRQGDLR
jgi:hypothetical protein